MKQKTQMYFLGAILLVGLLTIFAYGYYLDETSEQRIMFANIKEYLIQFQLEDTQLVQDLTDFGVLKISEDEDRDHGMAVYYPAFPVWYINQTSPYLGSLFWHLYTFLLVFWGICSLFFLSKALFQNEMLAGFLTLLFFLTPRMFAESHYNNKDVVLLSLLFSMLYYGYLLMKKPSFGNVFLLAFTGALATNMKIVGAWMFGIIGLYCLGYFIAKKRFDRNVLGKTILCIVLWMAWYVLLTPAMWSGVSDFFGYLIHYAVDYDLWHDWVLFNGKMVHQDYTGMPKKYLPVLILYTVPVGILLLSAIGCVAAVYVTVRHKSLWETEGYLCAALLTGAVPLAYAVLAATPLYNGWRHFYFVYGAILTGAGYGCYLLWQLAVKYRKEKLLAGIGGAYLAILAVGIMINYPQEHSYFNILAGRDVVNRYELDYWDMSAKQALEAVDDELSEGETALVGALNWPTMWGVQGNYDVMKESRKQGIQLIEDIQDWRMAEYVIVNTTYAVMYNSAEYEEIKQSYHLLTDFTSYGHTICEVYQKQ